MTGCSRRTEEQREREGDGGGETEGRQERGGGGSFVSIRFLTWPAC